MGVRRNKEVTLNDAFSLPALVSISRILSPYSLSNFCGRQQLVVVLEEVDWRVSRFSARGTSTD